jgi:glycosyltransferase involved in cell wall biosynthesis
MIPVLLVHAGIIPHYRVPIYNYLWNYLLRYGFEIIVVSDDIQADSPDETKFPYIKKHLSAVGIAKIVYKYKIKVVIDYMELRHHYLFPTYLIIKGILKRKMIYWGQGRDLLDSNSIIKNLAYASEQTFCDAIILYAEHLKKYVPRRLQKKVFIANNTLFINYQGIPPGTTREKILGEYGIYTKKNIICLGRMQKRKRIDHLVKAVASMNRPDVGLILAGPDPDGVLNDIKRENTFKLNSIYGDKKFDLLSAVDVYCLPGAVGLSIVDAFHCGLPFVTEEGDESAEIMYLKHGVNGFIVPRGDIDALRQKLLILLDDDELRSRFSNAAKREISANGNMNVFCSGFRDALFYATSEITREPT